MANQAEMLKRAEELFGEQILAVVVGPHYRREVAFDEPDAGVVYDDENVVLTRDVAMAKLDVEYDNGFGGADCYPIYAWTASRVFFMQEYDGATGLSWLPRNPTNCSPHFDGDCGYD